MSQINVNTIGARTGSTISIASGHLLDNNFGLEKLMSSTASSDDTLILDGFVDTSKYSQYKIVYNDLKAATQGQTLYQGFRQGGNSGSNLDGTIRGGYYFTKLNQAYSGTEDNKSYNNTGLVTVDVGSDSSSHEAFSGESTFYPTTDGITYITHRSLVNRNGGDMQAFDVYLGMETSTLATGLRYHFGSGAIASGNFYVYGVRK